jgi:outer membrane immunogenic protein
MLMGTIGTASAADMAVKAPPPVMAVWSWTGFYIGGDVGGTWARDRFDHSPFFALTGPFGALDIDAAAQTAAASPTLKGSGFSGGVYAGYNWQSGRVVFGGEADISGMDVNGTQTAVFVFPSTLPGGPIGPPTLTFPGTSSFHVDWQATFRGRLGLAANDWLFYGTGGLAVAGVRESQVVGNLVATAASSAFSTSDTRAGWVVGGGVEKAFARNWIFRVEYLHADYGNVGHTTTFGQPAGIVNIGCTPGTTIVVPAGGFSTTAGCSVSNHLTTDTVRVGLAYKFGGPVVARY